MRRIRLVAIAFLVAVIYLSGEHACLRQYPHPDRQAKPVNDCLGRWATALPLAGLDRSYRLLDT